MFDKYLDNCLDEYRKNKIEGAKMVERIRDIQNDEIRKLAETLKSSGLAASESEAIRIATGMSKTNVKVNQNFEERKGTASTMLANMNKVYPKREETPSFESQARTQQMNHQMNSQVNQQMPKTNFGFNQTQHNTQNQQQAQHKNQQHHKIEEETEIVKYSDSEQSLKDVFELEEDEIIKQEIITRDTTSEYRDQSAVVGGQGSAGRDQGSEVRDPGSAGDGQRSASQPKQVWEERKPKKDITKMEEHKVDLGSVFKFKG